MFTFWNYDTPRRGETWTLAAGTYRPDDAISGANIANYSDIEEFSGKKASQQHFSSLPACSPPSPAFSAPVQ